MSCGGDNFVVPGANPCNNGGGGGTAGVTTLNGFEGNVSITAGNASIGVSNQGGNIVLTATGLQAVDSINGESGALNIINGTNTSVITNGSDISINVPTPVSSLNSKTGAVTLQGVGETIITSTGNTIFVNTPPGVTSVNSVSGAMAITGTGATTVTTAGQGIVVNTPATTLNNLSGAMEIVGGTNVTVNSYLNGQIVINSSSNGLAKIDRKYITAPYTLLSGVENTIFSFTVPSYGIGGGKFVMSCMITVKSLTATPYTINTYYMKNGVRTNPSDTTTTVAGTDWFYTVPMIGYTSIGVSQSVTIDLRATISSGPNTIGINSGDMTVVFYPAN